MRYSEIRQGEYYLFDKDNTCNRIDTDIAVVRVVSKSRGLFRPSIVVYPLMPDKGDCEDNPFTITNEELLTKMSDNPSENIIIRYPSNLPVFSADDCMVMSKAFMYALNHSADCNLSDAEMIRMSSIVQKAKFYAEISEKYRPAGE